MSPTATFSVAAAGALVSSDDYVALTAAWPSPPGSPSLVCRAGPTGAGRNRSGFGAMVVLAWRRRGGHMGDVLGAAGVVAATVGLLMATARW
jgi:hypothetical protein